MFCGTDPVVIVMNFCYMGMCSLYIVGIFYILFNIVRLLFQEEFVKGQH